jgi:glutamate-1-semialdehyde 2,1-aminomutase
MANGFPLAAFGGRQGVMERVADTWISSTLATEFLSLAAARACLGVMEREKVPATLHRTGTRLLQGLGRLAGEFPDLVTRAVGVPEMCYLEYRDDVTSQAVAVGVARRGVLWKRSAYNFVSLAHDDAVVDQVLGTLAETLRDLRK